MVRDVYAYHGAVDAASREKSVAEFSRPLLPRPAILVCTDRASRGMDFNKARVRKRKGRGCTADRSW